MEQVYFSVFKNNCLKGSDSSYDPSISNTFKNETPYNISLGSWGKACLATEKCSLYSDLYLSKNISLDSLEFIFGNNTSTRNPNFEMNKLCGNVGLMKQSFNVFLSSNNFIYYLKNNKIIDSYSWGIFFFDKENSYNVDDNIQKQYNGFYIAGINSCCFSDKFDNSSVKDPNATMLLPIVFFSIINIFFGIFPNIIMGFLELIAGGSL